MSADIPHGLPGARSVARAFPCKRCTPRKVSSLFPWVSSCSTRWNQASPAPPPSPAGFTLVSAAYFSPLWQNCLARVNGRACAWNACEAWQESVCEWICVCGCVPCVRALGDDTYGSTRKKEKPAAPGKWQFVEETSELGSGDDAFFESFRGCFCSLCLFGIIPSRWFVWNRAQRNESYNLF